MKFDIFYQLPAARTQKVQTRYRELIDESVEADRLGFDTVWLAEVHFAPRFSVMPTPLLLLAAIAEKTTRLRLGMAVNLMPLHHPMRLAEEVATLDVLSGGRVEFGGGRGAFPLNYRGYGVGMETSRALFAEGLDFIKRAWTQDRVTFHGAHFRVDGIEVIPKPVQKPHPPIIVGGAFPYAARRAVNYGNGWIPRADRLEKDGIGVVIDKFRDMAKAAGRDSAELPITIFRVPEDLIQLRFCEEIGIDRIVFSLPAEKEDPVMPILDRWSAIKQQLEG